MVRSWYLLAGSYLVALGEAGLGYAGSPLQVPLHYDFFGQPDRWGSKLELLWVQVGVVTLLSSTLALIPVLVRRLPAALINLPHKEYWLRPERRAATEQRLGAWAHAFAAVLNLALSAVFAVQHLSTARGEFVLPSGLVPAFVAAILLFALLSSLLLRRTFRVPRAFGQN